MPTSSFRFPYIPLPKIDPTTGSQSDTYYPLIPMRLSYNHKIGRPFSALLDSGSDRSLFPAGLGIVEGINIKKGAFKEITGIGQYKISAYTHKVSFYLDSKKFSTEIDFSYEQEVPLLGRSGFFDLFNEIRFKEEAKEVVLTI